VGGQEAGREGERSESQRKGRGRDIHLNKRSNDGIATLYGQTQIVPIIRMDPLSTASRVGVYSPFRYVGQDTAGSRWVATAATGFVSDRPGYLLAR